MILDASAIIAIIVAEPQREELIQRIAEAPVIAVGAPTLVEAALVLSARLRGDPRPLLTPFLREAEVEIIPFTSDHYELALDAFQRYGKGRHPAGLNFGDCLTYAVAKMSGFPLLFTGSDFSQTDLACV
jgi:ribonuclease VapC